MVREYINYYFVYDLFVCVLRETSGARELGEKKRWGGLVFFFFFFELFSFGRRELFISDFTHESINLRYIVCFISE